MRARRKETRPLNPVARLVITAALVCGAASAIRGAEDFQAILEPYLKIHAALAGDKMDDVAADARAIAEAAAKLGTDGEGITTAARKLEGAGDLETARAAFGPLSDEIIAHGHSLGEDVKVAYCPMVSKSWLQKDGPITNPYYGQAMLRCGEFKKR